jgi:competence ComEA-like helix-hairpin-helix protein
MALFTRRDRIAIAVLAGIILAGWGARLYLNRGGEDTVQVIRGAVRPPAPSATPDTTAAVSSGGTKPEAALLVDINRADAAALDKLPLIGPAKAEAIIRYRVEHGPFVKPADIQQVKGIGPGIYSRIEKLISVGDGGGEKKAAP